MAKGPIRESADQLEKRKSLEELQIKLQELVDTKDVWTMSEFREAWNKKNNQKITELVKLNDRMICRLSKSQVTIKVKTMIL